MKITGIAALAGGLALAPALALAQPPAGGAIQARPEPKKAAAEAPGAAADPVEAIDREYARGLERLERQKLESLAKLAAGQAPEPANATYEALFTFAITRGLFREAEPIAERARQAPGASARVASLALLVDMVAEADRGEFDRSLESLVAAVRAADHAKGEGARPGAALPVSAQLSLLDAYYQLLLRAGRYDVARKALATVRDKAEGAEIKDFAADRLAHLGLIGRPAPPIAGADVDGKPFRLAEANKDGPVLVVFWASWCPPCAEEVGWIDRAYQAHRAQGLRVVGIDLDAAQGGLEAAAVLPTVRRFLIDHNVRWPTLVNGAGELDFAKAFGVTEIPANFLIGRDGKVLRIDLTGSNAEAAIAGAVGR